MVNVLLVRITSLCKTAHECMITMQMGSWYFYKLAHSFAGMLTDSVGDVPDSWRRQLSEDRSVVVMHVLLRIQSSKSIRDVLSLGPGASAVKPRWG
jgi:hypothetical protein